MKEKSFFTILLMVVLSILLVTVTTGGERIKVQIKEWDWAFPPVMFDMKG